ncbi:MAG: Hsp20/alpha crystallin family protein [Nitrospinae bacterium]|nr:Hsp20/alpha crystallin family protein [Nitrospinota bacterium]
MLLARRDLKERPMADLDPFGALSLFGELWPASLFGPGDKPYSPAMDVTETEADYKVRLEVPGMDKNDIKIECDNNILTISGEKKRETEEKSEKIYRLERSYGAFARSLRFVGADTEKISASYSNGLLEVTVPKTQKAQPIKISVE